MRSKTKQLNTFLMLKVPSAWICGVRIKEITTSSCRVQVKQNWINQNPFRSIYFAVQAMAAELSTGALVMSEIKQTGKEISMLVKNNNASFTKKATGRIIFECVDGDKIKNAVEKAIETGKGQTFWMQATGKNEAGIEVSTFNFEWTIKLK